MTKPRILVLCTGNSCRSIMAEGFLTHMGFDAHSAGSKPVGAVHPKSLETLARRGISLTHPRSKSWDEFSGQDFDYVITVCDNAAKESCPVFFSQAKKMHWPIPDPAAATGTETEIDKAFENAFQMIRAYAERDLLIPRSEGPSRAAVPVTRR